MMQEQVIITPVKISKAGQVKHFQIKLPSNAKHIIGIELGGKFLSQSKVNIAPAEMTASVPKEIIVPVPTAEQIAVSIPKEILTVKVPIVEQIGIPQETRGGAFKRNTLIGELKLQSCEEANIFYAGQLQLDNNIGYGDFSQTRFWRVTPFTHQTQQFEDIVTVDADSTIIQGYYKDYLGAQSKLDVNYQVSVYVWYRK